MQYENSTYDTSVPVSTSTITKVFGWTFVGLLITGLVAWFYPIILLQAFNQQTAAEIYSVSLVASLVAYTIFSFVSMIVIAKTKNGKIAIGMYMILTAIFGIVLSSIFLVTDAEVLLLSFAATAGIFGIMGLYGYITKRDLTRFGSILTMFLIGCLVMTLINFFARSEGVYWIVSYVMLAVIIGYVAFDIQRLKRVAQQGTIPTNIAIFFALQLYLDFVYIFIRIVAIIGQNRN